LTLTCVRQVNGHLGTIGGKSEVVSRIPAYSPLGK